MQNNPDVPVSLSVRRGESTKKATALGGLLAASSGWLFEKSYPGIELFSQGATPQLSSPLLRFTTEFGMDRCGATAPWTPGKISGEP